MLITLLSFTLSGKRNGALTVMLVSLSAVSIRRAVVATALQALVLEATVRLMTAAAAVPKLAPPSCWAKISARPRCAVLVVSQCRRDL